VNGVESVLRDLRKACDDAGGQSAWAKANEFSPAYVSDVLLRRREPADAICKALGYERFLTYRRVRNG